jgi:seryl-tRNA synthetase
MLDLNFVRDNLPRVEEMLRQRGADPAAVLKDFSDVDTQRRQAITEAETLKARRNKASEDIAKLKKSGQDATAAIAETKELREQIQAREKIAVDLNTRLQDILSGIPNMPHASVPAGHSAEENVEVRRWGQAPRFDFTPKPHWDIGAELGILDLERAVKLTGARFAVYWDMGAKLERALANFMLDLHTREHGYTEVLPPYLVNSQSMYGTGQLPKFAADSFKVATDRFEKNPHHTPVVGELVQREGIDRVFEVVAIDPGARTADIKFIPPPMDGDHLETNVPWGTLFYERSLWLIPTAEVPVTNLFRGEILDAARLPISLTAYTPCFRSEAGSYGKDVRGIIRQHQFQKVEMVKFSRPEDSYEEHEKLTRNAETILQKLGLHYRIVALCTGDMGAASAKTYDIEVWLPGQQLFREISSCSNFESYQARRANIRYRPEGKNKTEFVHTLNGSGLAVGRTWVAIVENYQQADGSVVIPEALRPYIGAERITAKSF